MIDCFSLRVSRSLLLLILLLSLLLLLLYLVALDDDQEVVPIGCYHHVIYLAGDSKECQVVLWVQIANKTTSGYGQLRKTDGVLDRFLVLSHGRSHNLWLVSLLHLGLLDDDEALDVWVSLNSGDTLLDFTLYRLKKARLVTFDLCSKSSSCAGL